MKQILLVGFIVVTNVLYAQLSLGIRGAVNYSDIKVSNYQHPIIEDITTTSEFGYQVGFFAKANVLKFFVQPEIIFGQINSEVKVLLVNGETINYPFKLFRLDIPIPIGFEIGVFKLMAGPVASFNLTSGASLFDNTYNQGVWSIMGGAGVNLGKVVFEFRYESALDNHANQAEVIIGEELFRIDMDSRTSVFLLSVGYTF